MRVRYKSISPLKDAGDSVDEESHGFRGDVAQSKYSWQKELEIEGREEIIDTFGNDTWGWGESHLEYRKLKRRLSAGNLFKYWSGRDKEKIR